MPDISVKFVHPTDGRVMTVIVEDSMTAQEVVGELVAHNFVPSHGQGYQLSVIESGNILGGQHTLAGAGVKRDSRIRVLPVTEAGSSGRN